MKAYQFSQNVQIVKKTNAKNFVLRDFSDEVRNMVN